MTKPAIIHLLIPMEFRVWCRPNSVPDRLHYTRLPSVATCANCLSAYRYHVTGNTKPFRVSHVAATRHHDWEDL